MLFTNRIHSFLSEFPSPLFPHKEFTRFRSSDVTHIWDKIAPKMVSLSNEMFQDYDHENNYFARTKRLKEKKNELSLAMEGELDAAKKKQLRKAIKGIRLELRNEELKRHKIIDFVDDMAKIFLYIDPALKQKFDDLAFIGKLKDIGCDFFDVQADLYHRLDSIPYDPYYSDKKPTDTGDVRLMEIDEEIRDEKLPMFRFFELYFCHFSKLLKKEEKLDIINYLEGNAKLDDLNITRENAANYLQLAKVVDLAQKHHFLKYGERSLFTRSTYKIRLRILELLSPDLKTIEAFTYTLDANKLKNIDYTKNSANWLPERINFYAQKVIPHEYINMRALSDRLNCNPPVIYAFRGTSCAGKTTCSKGLLGINPSENVEEILGVMSHDTVKNILKKRTCSVVLTNDQVHDEAARGPLKRYKQEIMQNSKESLILDYRMTSIEELEEAIDAARNGRVVRIIELDAPLTTLYQRMLTRDPHGATPCQQPSVIKQGLLDIRQSRRAMIERILQEPLIESYDLHYSTRNGMVEIASKVGSTLQIYHKELFEECCTIPSEADMAHDSQIVINSHWGPFERVQIPIWDYRSVHAWSGFTLEQAVRFKGLGISPREAVNRLKLESERMARYGKVIVEPFSNAWLLDYPEVLKHVITEHKLHNRNDIGLWPTTKFSSSMNKTYASEASIQMKLGYFMVRSKFINEEKSNTCASPDVLRDLGVSSGYYIDSYRLFVHPEAYEHFQALHDAGIPFVTPEESEFMGTPTSSYRSWVVRRVYESKSHHWPPREKTVPFIAKLGVGSSSNPSKLLSTDEIQRSIRIQELLDKHSNPHLCLFPERFGISLSGISNYPPPTNSGAVSAISSGMIIREFPKQLLEGEYSIISFQSIQSMERSKEENKGVCKLPGSREGTEGLPLIYELIDIAMQKKVVKTPAEYIERYLVRGVMEAFEKLIFELELSLSLHAQNLCLVLDKECIPIGFAYRDFGDVYSDGINQTKRFTGSFTVSWKYYDLIKTLNIISTSENEFLPHIPGTPVEVGCSEPLQQKSMNYYLRHQSESSSKTHELSQKILSELSITLEEYLSLLRLTDDAFISKLNAFFSMDVHSILSSDGTFPAAEINSAHEKMIFGINQTLLKSRRKPRTFSTQSAAASSQS